MLANQIPLRVMPSRISSQLLLSDEKKRPTRNMMNETFRASGDEEKASNETSIHLWGYSPDFAATKRQAIPKESVSRFSIGPEETTQTNVELVAKVRQALKQNTISVATASELVELALTTDVPAAEPAHYEVFQTLMEKDLQS